MIQAQEHEQQQWQIYDKLQQARIALQSMELKKSGHNKFAGYKYFELGDFLPAVNNIFGNLVDLESYIITGKCEELEESKYMRDFILV
jgi:hypothetical protein